LAGSPGIDDRIVENQVGYPIGIPCRIGDGHRAGRPTAAERKAVNSHVVNDRFEVTQPRVERVVFDLTV
jgi:hypothetical protein